MANLGVHLDPYFSTTQYPQNMHAPNPNDFSNPNLAKRQFEERPNFNLNRAQPSPLGFCMPPNTSYQQGGYQGFSSQSGFGFPGSQESTPMYNELYNAQYQSPFVGSPFMTHATPFTPAVQPAYPMGPQHSHFGFGGGLASPAPAYNSLSDQAFNGSFQNNFAQGAMRPNSRHHYRSNKPTSRDEQDAAAPMQNTRLVPGSSSSGKTLSQAEFANHPLVLAQVGPSSKVVAPEVAPVSAICAESDSNKPIPPYPANLPLTPQHNFQYPQAAPTMPQENALMRELLEGDAQQCKHARAVLVDKDNMPFADTVGLHGPAKFGVVKIGNIPYAVTKQEIIHFIGRSAKMIPADRGCPIHIIMERSTSKTMDCFVEFVDQEEAAAAVRRYWHYVESGKHPRLGTRHVDMDLSSQDELLKDLFPRAKCVLWKDGNPTVLVNTDPYSTGYQGFFTSEEMVGLARHAEHPQRSPFSTKCLQRTYECMISTLYKFPWHATHLYTVKDRNTLFETYMKQMAVLVRKVEQEHIVGLDLKLFNDFLFAGLNCPGFTERLKHQIIVDSGRGGSNIFVSNLASFWPFDTVGRKIMQNDHFVEFYMNLVERGAAVTDIGEATHSFFRTSQPESYLPQGLFSNMQYWIHENSTRLTWSKAHTIESTLMLDLVTNGIEHLLKERAEREGDNEIARILAEEHEEHYRAFVEAQMAEDHALAEAQQEQARALLEAQKEQARILAEQGQGSSRRKSTGENSQRGDDNAVTPSSARSLSTLHSHRGSIIAQNKPIFDPEGLCGPFDVKTEVETIQEEDEDEAV